MYYPDNPAWPCQPKAGRGLVIISMMDDGKDLANRVCKNSTLQGAGGRSSAENGGGGARREVGGAGML